MFALFNPVVGEETSRGRNGTVESLGAVDRQLKVALLGIDRRTELMLRMFFQTHCEDRYVASDEEQNADLSIVDLDGHQGETLWREHTERFPGRPCILLSLTDTDVGDGELVSKPLRIKKLQAALDKTRDRLLPQSQFKRAESVSAAQNPLRQAIEKSSPLQLHPAATESKGRSTVRSEPTGDKVVSRKAHTGLRDKEIYSFIGSTPDMDLNDPRQAQKTQYDPDQYLVGQVLAAFRLAQEKQKPVRLATRHGSVTLLPEINSILVEMENRHLRSLAAVPIRDEDISLSALKPEQVVDASQEAWQDLDIFIWHLTLIASRGRVPIGTDPAAPVTLRNWPNLTRLRLFPHALQIAALWINQPTSLQDTATELGIQQRFVFAFYSATRNLGLVKIDAPEQTQSQPAKKRVKQGLLGRILKHLQFGENPEFQHT